MRLRRITATAYTAHPESLTFAGPGTLGHAIPGSARHAPRCPSDSETRVGPSGPSISPPSPASRDGVLGAGGTDRAFPPDCGALPDRRCSATAATPRNLGVPAPGHGWHSDCRLGRALWTALTRSDDFEPESAGRPP
jgi:hypothetical protein